MLRVRPVQAKPGMVLAMPIFHPRSEGTLLLKAGVELEEPTIARLRDLRVPEMWIRYPSLDVVGSFVSPRVQASRGRISAQVTRAFDAIRHSLHARLEFNQYRAAVSRLLTKLCDEPSTAVFMDEIVGDGEPAVRHATNVGFISMLVGLKLEFYMVAERDRLPAPVARDVTNLGVSAMLHDIGMTRLPAPVLSRWNASHDDADVEWREHVRIGYDIVRGGIDPSAAAAVLNHHQKYDGSGFPRRRTFAGEVLPIAGREIHIFSRIVAAADLFDRLRNPRCAPGAEVFDQPSVPVVRALSILRKKPYCDWIDPMVFKGLLNVVPAYAPGSIVRLSNGVRGVVIDWNASDPCRPVVVEIGESDDDMTPPDVDAERIVMGEDSGLRVVEIDGQDVSADNFFPETESEFDIDAVARSMMTRSELESFGRWSA